MVAPKGNTAMWLKQVWLSFFILTFLLTFGLMLLTLRLTSSIVCPHRFSKVSHLFNSYMVPLPITKIFIHLVVVFILVYVITWLTSFPLGASLAFLWVIIHLIKVFVVLTPPPPDSILPAMLNLMKTTFLFTILPKPNQYPLSKSHFFWNWVSLLQTCPCIPLHQTPHIFLYPNPPHVLFVLIQ